MYSSRTRYTTDVYRRLYGLKMRLAKTLAKVPEEQLTDEERRLREEFAGLPEIAILHIIYRRPTKDTPKTMSSRTPLCGSIGKAAVRIPAGL